ALSSLRNWSSVACGWMTSRSSRTTAVWSAVGIGGSVAARSDKASQLHASWLAPELNFLSSYPDKVADLSRQSRNQMDLQSRVPPGAMVVLTSHHHTGGTRCCLFWFIWVSCG